jgi:5-(carboxyamino)imidazole ribonucleotide mutase
MVLRGTVGDVKRAVRERLEIIGEEGAYILSTACSVPPGAPPENVRALAEAVEEVEAALDPAPGPAHHPHLVGAKPAVPVGASPSGRSDPSPQNRTRPMADPLVGVIMGSRSDWECMSNAVEILEALDVPHEVRVVSAHRTPDLLFEYAETAEERGLEVIIAGAGGAAHLPGMVASKTVLPVLGVPVQSRALQGLDSLLSIVQMPGGIPVGTLAIGRAGAVNAALLATAILGARHPELRERLRDWRDRRTLSVLDDPDPRVDAP